MILPLAGQESKPAQYTKYIESTGSRAALLGREDGTFEAWLFPIKLVRDFRLSVYIDNALEPTPLADFAERVEFTPARTTIVHAHAAFTIRQTWFAAVEEQVAAVVLEVETSRPLRLRASFTPEMKPMWPASFGGQSSYFDAEAKVFTFGEGLRRFRPVMGSPMFVRSSEQIGHQLPDRTVLLEMEIARAGEVPIVFAPSRDAYAKALPRLPQLMAEAERHYERLLRESARLRTPDARLNGAYRHALLALDKGWVCNEGVGCGLVAGWAPSGLSERPGFGWYFGGDAFFNSWALLDAGQFTRVRDILKFLRDKQREDGRIPHEWTQSAALLDWSKYPYGYYHADTTPLYLFSLWRYVQRSGDRTFLEESWPSVRKAYQACLSYADPDGLLSNRRGGAAAVETGALSGKVDKDIYLQGVWLAALDALARLAAVKGEAELEKEAAGRLTKAREALTGWFQAGRGNLAFAQLTGGERYGALSGWQSFALAHGGLPEAAARTAARTLSLPVLSTPWGTRLFATDSPNYDALSYNDGSVWPFVTGFAIQAQFRHGEAAGGLSHLLGLASATGLQGHGFMPEYLSGDRFQALPRSVPHQLFSSSPIVEGALSGLLGLDGDALAGTVRVAPRVPADWPEVEFAGYRVGGSVVSGTVRRSPGNLSIEVRITGAPLKVSLEAPDGQRREGTEASFRLAESFARAPEVRLSPGQAAAASR